MKEITRYAVLLFGVVTLITSSYIAINLADEPDTGQTGEPAISPSPEINDSDSDNIDNTSNNSVSQDSDELDDPEGLLEKSIYGFRMMFQDMEKGLEILSEN